jgi:hypothetical protein
MRVSQREITLRKWAWLTVATVYVTAILLKLFSTSPTTDDIMRGVFICNTIWALFLVFSSGRLNKLYK